MKHLSVQAASKGGRDIFIGAIRDKCLPEVDRAGPAVALGPSDPFHDVLLDAVTDSQRTTGQGFQGGAVVKTSNYDEGVRGSTLSGTNGVSLYAGQDINAVAATVTSSDGAVIAYAERDINLLAGQNLHAQATDRHSTQSGTLSRKTATTHDETLDLTAVGTTFSGKNGVVVDAGRNVQGIGTTLQSSEGGIAVTAGDKVSLLAASDTHITNYSEKASRSGLGYALSSDAGTKKKEITTQQITKRGQVHFSMNRLPRKLINFVDKSILYKGLLHGSIATFRFSGHSAAYSAARE